MVFLDMPVEESEGPSLFFRVHWPILHFYDPEEAAFQHSAHGLNHQDVTQTGGTYQQTFNRPDFLEMVDMPLDRG